MKKEVMLLIVSALVSMNLLYSVNELKEISEHLIYVERCLLMQQSENHEDDVAIEAYEELYSDEELVEILGL